MTTVWQPSASLEVIQERATLLKCIRRFMDARGILEVETPLSSGSGNPDPHLHSFHIQSGLGNSRDKASRYLNTSPEFAMKRLLAAGTGSIYQIARVFRDDESGRLHQPEFTLLEWYRIGMDHHTLMDELGELLVMSGLLSPERVSYAEVFGHFTGLDAHRSETGMLQDRAAAEGLVNARPDRAMLLEFLFSHFVAPELGRGTPQFIYDYPESQAALARVRADSVPVAERFELFIEGIEIANGFHELGDAAEQTRRFEQDNVRRRERQLPEVDIDDRLIAALEAGLPDCAGVALGVDRLLMVIMGYDRLDKVVSFTVNRS